MGCASRNHGPLFVTHRFDGPGPGYRLPLPMFPWTPSPPDFYGPTSATEPKTPPAVMPSGPAAEAVQTVSAEASVVPPAPTPEGAAPAPLPTDEPPTPDAPLAEPTVVPDAASYDIQCAAAAESAAVALLRAERRMLRSEQNLAKPAVALFDRVIGYRIALRANEASATALQLYYELGTAAAGIAAVDRSLAELNAAKADQAQARAEGFDAGGFDLDARQATLLARREELESLLTAGQSQLRAKVGGRCGLPLPSVEPLLPSAPQPDEAVALGLQLRPDLNLIRDVAAHLDQSSLPIAVGVLQTIDPALGLTLPGGCPLPFCKTGDVEGRRRQLCIALARQSETAAGDIRAAAEKLRGIGDRYGETAETARLRRSELDRLENRRASGGDVSAAAVTTARLAAIDADSTRDQWACEYRKTWATLRAAQGMLAVECGYVRPPRDSACRR